jgi:hypothetical protein
LQGRPARHAGEEAGPSGAGAGGSGQVRLGTAGPNKSRYRGVSYDKKKRKWRVQIKARSLCPVRPHAAQMEM